MKVIKTTLLEDDDILLKDRPIRLQSLTPKAFSACVSAEFVVYKGTVIKDRHYILFEAVSRKNDSGIKNR